MIMTDNNSIQPNSDSWKGCTLEELRQRRLLAYVRVQLQKEKLASSLAASQEARSKGFLGLISGNMSVFDYVRLGFKAYLFARRFFIKSNR